jgi:hypothetical protein
MRYIPRFPAPYPRSVTWALACLGYRSGNLPHLPRSLVNILQDGLFHYFRSAGSFVEFPICEALESGLFFCYPFITISDLTPFGVIGSLLGHVRTSPTLPRASASCLHLPGSQNLLKAIKVWPVKAPRHRICEHPRALYSAAEW